MPSSSARIAVIGSGAAAAGALLGLREQGVKQVTVITTGEIPQASQDTHPQSAILQCYQDIRSGPRQIPPRKSLRGEPIHCYRSENNDRMFKSDYFGGLTEVWGAVTLPLSDRELRGWPIDRADLDPHYRSVAEHLGISGRKDSVDNFYGGNSYTNRPETKQLASMSRLSTALDGVDSGDYKFFAGMPKLAVETRTTNSQHCVSCGECMAMCAYGAIYSAKNTIEQCVKAGMAKITLGRVLCLEKMPKNQWQVILDTGQSQLFDKVLLCAGVMGTTEILMRTRKESKPRVVEDNALFQFPLLDRSIGWYKTEREYFGLTNLLTAMQSKVPGGPDLQIQFYPNADFLLRAIVAERSWQFLSPLYRQWRNRLLWGRIYMPAEHSAKYEISLQGDSLNIQSHQAANVKAARAALRQIRLALRKKSYSFLGQLLIQAHTSAHLAATYPPGDEFEGDILSSEILKGVHICDASCFPNSPVSSPTFTIIANARRIAMRAVSNRQSGEPGKI